MVHLPLTSCGRHKKGEAGQDKTLLRTRAYHRSRSVKLARTIADLAGCEEIRSLHLAEALHAPQPAKVDDGIISNLSLKP